MSVEFWRELAGRSAREIAVLHAILHESARLCGECMIFIGGNWYASFTGLVAREKAPGIHLGRSFDCKAAQLASLSLFINFSQLTLFNY